MSIKHIQVTYEYSLIEDLFQAYYDARKNKRNSISALKFELNYEKNLIDLYHEIIERKYKPKPYTAFIVEKPVKREIFASEFRDRVVHHLIFNYINPVFDRLFINDSYSCRQGKGTSYGIKRADYFMRACSQNYQKDAYVLKLDIEGYFMSIDRSILFDLIKSEIIKRQNKLSCQADLILFLLETVIFCDPTMKCKINGSKFDWCGLPKSKSLFFSGANKGLPIGNLTSQLFANIYLNQVDQFIKTELKFKYYGRYVDDMIFVDSDKEKLLSSIELIKVFLSKNLLLKIHPRKIYIQNITKGVSFLGMYIKPYRIIAGKRLKNNFYHTVFEGLADIILFDFVDEKAKRYQISKFCESSNSYFGILKHYNSFQFRKVMFELAMENLRGYLKANDEYSLFTLKRFRSFE